MLSSAKFFSPYFLNNYTMGSSASVVAQGILPAKIDLETFKNIAPEHFSQGVFNKLKGPDNLISIDRFITFATMEAKDAFITHNWGEDELKRNNHVISPFICSSSNQVLIPFVVCKALFSFHI